jgi:hypothetical protein
MSLSGFLVLTPLLKYPLKALDSALFKIKNFITTFMLTKKQHLRDVEIGSERNKLRFMFWPNIIYFLKHSFQLDQKPQ